MSNTVPVIDADALERMVDSYSLPAILATLANICHDKASHIQENWQDDALARVWDRAGRATERFSRHAAITLLPRP